MKIPDDYAVLFLQGGAVQFPPPPPPPEIR